MGDGLCDHCSSRLHALLEKADGAEPWSERRMSAFRSTMAIWGDG
jgi:hypothetical protein